MKFSERQLETALRVASAIAPDLAPGLESAVAAYRGACQARRVDHAGAVTLADARRAAWAPVAEANARCRETRMAYEAIRAQGWSPAIAPALEAAWRAYTEARTVREAAMAEYQRTEVSR